MKAYSSSLDKSILTARLWWLQPRFDNSKRKMQAVSSKSIVMKLALLILASRVLPFTCAFGQTAPLTPTAQPTPPRVLLVVAHPDDESCFAATVYQITHSLHGIVDQLIVTNGEGGFRYSLLAETVYGVQLVNENIGRDALPEIRKREALDSGRILGIRNHFFLDERDLRYTQDLNEVLEKHWDTPLVMEEVKHRLEVGHYDFVLGLFPSADAHGGHKAATLAAYSSIEAMRKDRPVLLGCELHSLTKTAPREDWVSSLANTHPYIFPERYSIDRTEKFGFNNVSNYQIVVNWVIAAHKSQGAFQKDAEQYDREDFAVIDTSTTDAVDKATNLFKALHFETVLPMGREGRMN